MKIYVSKDVLFDDIYTVDAEILEMGQTAKFKEPDGWRYLSKPYWSENLEDAIHNANNIKEARIKKVEFTLEELRNFEIKVRDDL